MSKLHHFFCPHLRSFLAKSSKASPQPAVLYFLSISTQLWVRSSLEIFMTYTVFSCPLALSHPSSHFPLVKYFFSQLSVADGKFLLSQSLLLICHWSHWQRLLADASCCLLLSGNYRTATATGSVQDTELSAHSGVWKAVSSELLGRKMYPLSYPLPSSFLVGVASNQAVNHISATVLGNL